MKKQATVKGQTSFGEVLTDEEWNTRYRRLEARYDTRRDEKRRPSVSALLVLVGLLLMLGAAGALTYIHVFMS